MLRTTMWQHAFVATSAALGEPMDAIVSSLGPDQAPVAGALIDALRAESRQQRARAMAQHLAAVAADVDAMHLRLAW